MSRILLLIGLLCTASLTLWAQTPLDPLGGDPPSGYGGYNPQRAAAFSRVISVKGMTTDTSLINFGASPHLVSVVTQYTDGLGRPLQTVARGASPGGKDVVAPTVYDQFGRQPKKFLPYVASGSDGIYKTKVLEADSLFYAALHPGDPYFYSQTLFETSPRSGPQKSMSPGASAVGAGRGVTATQRANHAADSVRLWSIAAEGENALPVTYSFYNPNTLLVQETTNEMGQRSVVYKDERGQTVLTKVQAVATPSTGHTGWLCTYYVYTEAGLLRAVLPPKAIEGFQSYGWGTIPTVIEGLCYLYHYDDRGRAIMKQVPGKGKTYLVYDKLDRVVMTQDARLRGMSQWVFAKYDAEDRPVNGGIITTGASHTDLQSSAAGSEDYPVLTGTYTITSETFYDQYTWVASSGSGLNATLAMDASTTDALVSTHSSAPLWAQPVAPSGRIRGSVTGSKKLILGTSQYLWSLTLYDNAGRVIQTKETNHTGGWDVLTLQYDFTGKPLRSHLSHAKGGANAQSHTVASRWSYDGGGRLLTLEKALDGSGYKTISQIAYNELGQPVQKIIGGGAEIQHYAYRLDGALRSINGDFVTGGSGAAPGAPGSFFGEVLERDTVLSGTPQWSGNTAATRWRAGGDRIARRYAYSYDLAGRLLSAAFTQQNRGGTTAWTADRLDFTLSGMTYDAGGNPLSMKQRGVRVQAIETIDSLLYTYLPQSNQLQRVWDGGSAAPTHRGADFSDTTATTDYVYDVNGNTTTDHNRRMTGGAFNLLGKPDSLQMAGMQTVAYTYDAGGMKLTKGVRSHSTGKLSTYSYVAGFVYKNDTLQYALHEEGRIRWAQKRSYTTGSPYWALEWDYFLRDAMGNVRTVITEGRDTAGYKATAEVADSVNNRALFSHLYDPTRTVWDKPSGFDSDGNNARVIKLNGSSGSNKKTGAALVIRVMAGDKIETGAFAWYNASVQPPGDPSAPILQLVTALSSGVTGPIGHFGSSAAGDVSGAATPGLESFVNNRNYDNSRPKAYLNWVLLDGQFRPVQGAGEARQVEPIVFGEGKKAVIGTPQTITQNGYLYVWVSNESAQDVFFDDVVVKHTTGALLEEKSFYPFGGKIEAISDRAFNKLAAVQGYNGGVDFEEETGYYNTFYRQYDAQIGRFTGVDVLAESQTGFNPYHFGGNNPANFNDPLGDQMGDPVRRYKDASGSTWHSPSVLQGTGFGYAEYDWLSHAIRPDSWMGGGGGPRSSEGWMRLPGLGERVVQRNGRWGYWQDMGWRDGEIGDASIGREQELIGTQTWRNLGGLNWAIGGAFAIPLGEAIGGTIVGGGTVAAGTVAGVVVVAGVIIAAPFLMDDYSATPKALPHGQMAMDNTAVARPLILPINPPLPTLPLSVPFAGHGNMLSNSNPHLVYQFTYAPPPLQSPVLKYGIADMYSTGYGRPGSQLAGLHALYGASVSWSPVMFTPNRGSALAAERGLVEAHRKIYGARPIAQRRP